jgi:hypothetical protein
LACFGNWSQSRIAPECGPGWLYTILMAQTFCLSYKLEGGIERRGELSSLTKYCTIGNTQCVNNPEAGGGGYSFRLTYRSHYVSRIIYSVKSSCSSVFFSTPDLNHPPPPPPLPPLSISNVWHRLLLLAASKGR